MFSSDQQRLPVANADVNVHTTAVTTYQPVIQQRGNVIVSRSQFIGEINNGLLRYHQLHSQSAQDKKEENRSTETEFATLITNSHIGDHNHEDNSSKPSASNVQSKKTEQNSNNKSRTDDKPGKTVHANFTCEHCQKNFRHKSYFEYHLRTHTGERPFQCNLCEKSFFERSKLNRHLSSCHNVKNSNYYVDDDEKSKTCLKCEKKFSRSSGLQAHIKTHHEGWRQFPCTKCNKNFSGLTALKNHEKSHQGLKSILCHDCGKAFLLKKYLDLHLKTTHKREARKFKCSLCRKEFHFEKDLKRHQLMHSSVKNFKCSHCQTSFKRKDNLYRHLKLTHLLTPEQIREESGKHLEINQPNVVSSQPQLENSSHQTAEPVVHPTPAINQVSVIKSTQEVIMSITRGHQFI